MKIKALSVPCPFCGASTGLPCRASRNRSLHSARIAAATRAQIEADPWGALGLAPSCPGCGVAAGDPCEESCREHARRAHLDVK